MTITLAQARQRVRFLIDDTDNNPLVSDADISIALITAQEEVWQRVITAGVDIYTQEVNVSSTAAGAVDLTTINPLRIEGVAWQQGAFFLQVPPTRGNDYSYKVAVAQPLRIRYIPRAVFPINDAATFLWATGVISSPTLDQLMCVVAAADVWVKTGEQPLPSLERRKEELSKSVDDQANTTQWTSIPIAAINRFPTGNVGFMWTMTGPLTMQLVYG